MIIFFLYFVYLEYLPVPVLSFHIFNIILPENNLNTQYYRVQQ